jgi:hypothetical protein
MRLNLVALAVALAGCGGSVPPELYALIVDTVAIPATCFATAPTGSVAKGPLGTTQVQVFDGPEGKAFMVADTAMTFDMGDAPSVTVSASEALEGTNGPMGWSFVGDRDFTTVTGVGGISQTVQTKTHIAVALQRSATGKGTLSLSSSRTCTGTGCGASPACSIDSIPFRSTRLQVDFERSP